MRRLRKILSRSTVNQAESKNVFQILLLYLFIAVSMELFFFFLLFVITELFNHFCCSLNTWNTKNLCLVQAKFLSKITNFKRIAGGFVLLSTPTEVRKKKFAKITQSNSDRILSMWKLSIMK